jgi:hypothetical protein
MGHFAFYEYIPPHGRFRGRVIHLARRMLRGIWWPIYLDRERRLQKVYDRMQAIRAEQRRLDAAACVRLATQRRLDFIEKALDQLQSPGRVDHSLRPSNSGPPRARVA